MAITDAYVTVSEYKKDAGKLSSEDDDTIRRHLLTATRFFERETGQFFGKDASVVNRLFRARYSDRLDLDYEGNCPGIADTTGLVVKVDTDDDGSFSDETAWTINVDFRLEPLQAGLGPEPRPWDTIRRERGSSYSFIPGNLVQVTAIFGWPSVPEAVKSDVIEICRIWRIEGPRSTGRIDELDAVVAASPMAMSMVSRIRDAYRARVSL